MIYPDDSDYSIMSFLFSNYELLVWVGGLELCRYPNSQNPLARFFFGIQEHQPSSPTWQIYIAITITHRTRWVMSFMVFRQLFFFVPSMTMIFHGMASWDSHEISMISQWNPNDKPFIYWFILIYMSDYINQGWSLYLSVLTLFLQWTAYKFTNPFWWYSP